VSKGRAASSRRAGSDATRHDVGSDLFYRFFGAARTTQVQRCRSHSRARGAWPGAKLLYPSSRSFDISPAPPAGRRRKSALAGGESAAELLSLLSQPRPVALEKIRNHGELVTGVPVEEARERPDRRREDSICRRTIHRRLDDDASSV